jgi:putative mRNA 3-end processing factor
MLLKILGAAKEVGRSGFMIKDSSMSILLDYGILLHREPGFPIHVRPKDVDATIITHAHLDHVGMLPIFFLGRGVNNYMTPTTFKLSKLLLYDMVKISGPHLPFGDDEIEAVGRKAHELFYNEPRRIGKLEVEVFNAGHIPGSMMVYIRGERSILYTGDVNHMTTQLTEPTNRRLPEADVIITESTYALVDHPDRKTEEKRLVEYAKEVVERGGTLLIPSFSVGRAQEIAMIFYSYNFPYKVYMDGMALKANEIIMEDPEFVRDPKKLEAALNKVEYVESWGKRRRAVKEPSVIISPAGMLVGGASVFYNTRVAKEKKNGIAIVSFQIPGTPGRDLLDKKYVILDGKRMKVKAQVERFDLSSHSGRTDLLKMFKEDIRGSPKVFTVHGERESCEGLAKELNEMGYDAIAPERGDVYEI